MRALKWPKTEKPFGDKSGDRGDHATLPLRTNNTAVTIPFVEIICHSIRKIDRGTTVLKPDLRFAYFPFRNSDTYLRLKEKFPTTYNALTF